MVDCMECTNFIECHYSGQLTGRLTSCPDFKQKPKTNADRIRDMTDEELAKFLVSVENRRRGNSCGAVWHLPYVALEWLKQPAEGDA